MTITELQQQYAAHPHTDAVNKLLNDTSVKHLFAEDYALPLLLFSSSLIRKYDVPFVFILGDLEEAGYFYHDLTQILGTGGFLFFPSSFRRAIKYGQKMLQTKFCTEHLVVWKKIHLSVSLLTLMRFRKRWFP